MTEEEYLARLGLLRPQSGKRKPQEPVPPGSSVLDVPIGGTRRIPDTVLRRQYEGPNVGEATPYDPTLRERLAAKTQDVFEGLGADRYKARQRAETILGGPSSNLPLQIGLADFAPFLGTTIQTEEAGRGLEQAGRDIQRGDYLSAGIEGLGAGLGLLPGLSATAKGAKAVGKRVREAADPEAIRQYIRQTQGLTGMPGTAVVKEPGGNYVARAVEKSTNPLKKAIDYTTIAGRANIPPTELAAKSDAEIANLVSEMPETKLNQWIEKKLNTYIKNEMATARDPVRKQADEWADTQKELLAQKDKQIARLREKIAQARQARGLTPDQEALLTRSRTELEELRTQRKYIADQKGLHVDPRAAYEMSTEKNGLLQQLREQEGFPAEGLAKNQTAKYWEDLADMSVNDLKAKNIQDAKRNAELAKQARVDYEQTVMEVNRAVLDRVAARTNEPNILKYAQNEPHMFRSLRTPEENERIIKAGTWLRESENLANYRFQEMFEQNPWVAKLDPEARLFDQPFIDELQFDHLIDELKNAMSPAGGLPESLRISPQDLEKMTVPRAVKLIDEINAYRTQQMDLAAKTSREGIPVFKTYDEGYEWTAVPDTQADEKARKYVTSVGCESGWCTAGESTAMSYGGGGNKLYVLHDPDGKSVVQISVRPMDDSTFQRQVDWKQYSALQDKSQSEADKWLAQQRQSMPSEIVEIKGRQNRPPKEEHLPMVQDFVRSGNWSRVGDLDNTGLFQVGNKYFNQSEIKSMTEPAIRFLEEAPMLNRHRQAMQTYRNFKGPIPSPEFDALNREIDKIVDPSIPYTYSELVGILHEPKAYGIDSLGKVLEAVERLKAMSGQGYAAGGLVQTTDTLRDNLVAAGMDPDLALMQGLRMAEQVEMQAGGLASKTLKGAFRGAEKAIPRIETKGFQEFRADAPFIRAEEASKHQFETGKPVIVESYTGTRRDFSEIDPGLSSAGYFSSNKPIVANEYAGVFPEGALSQPFPTGGNIQKSFIRMDNPLFINARGASFNRVDTRGLPGFGLPMSNTDMINLWAKQQGYDGVVYKDLRDSMALPSGQNAPASNVYVSFKPNYVKSAIGNRGTYDVKERDMTKAEGGLL